MARSVSSTHLEPWSTRLIQDSAEWIRSSSSFRQQARLLPAEYVFSNPAPVTITVTPLPPPLVTVSGVTEVFNKHHDLTGILVQFSGAVNPTLAVSSGTLPAGAAWRARVIQRQECTRHQVEEEGL